jgi:hypothetical protein
MKFVVSVLRRAAGAASTTRRIGEFEQFEDAVVAAKQVVNDVLSRGYVAGMTAPQLLAHYQAAAEAPYIFRDDEGTVNASSFNHFNYAKSRSDEMCAGTK